MGTPHPIKTLRVGLTGGMGSGKSVVRRVWERLGAVCLDADGIARQMMETDPVMRSQLMDVFGKDAFQSDGRLNRDYLSREAFTSGRVRELNAIVHPAVIQRIRELTDEAERLGAAIVVKEAALLLSKGRPEDLDVIVAVVAEAEDRIRWIMQRDGVDRTQAVSRFGAQPDQAVVEAKADIVIRNDSGLEDLEVKAEKVYHQLMERTEQ